MSSLELHCIFQMKQSFLVYNYKNKNIAKQVYNTTFSILDKLIETYKK